MSKLEKLRRFMKFWWQPWGAAKGEMWEALTNDSSFDEITAERICNQILDGTDTLDWRILDHAAYD